MTEIEELRARVEKLEALAAHQERAIEELGGTVAGQWKTIEAMKRQLTRLDDELREVEAGLPAPPNQRPPHY